MCFACVLFVVRWYFAGVLVVFWLCLVLFSLCFGGGFVVVWCCFGSVLVVFQSCVRGILVVF